MGILGAFIWLRLLWCDLVYETSRRYICLIGCQRPRRNLPMSLASVTAATSVATTHTQVERWTLQGRIDDFLFLKHSTYYSMFPQPSFLPSLIPLNFSVSFKEKQQNVLHFLKFHFIYSFLLPARWAMFLLGNRFAKPNIPTYFSLHSFAQRYHWYLF